MVFANDLINALIRPLIVSITMQTTLRISFFLNLQKLQRFSFRQDSASA
jgi:hypothetical protein